MNKNDLVIFLNKLLKPLGFVKKASNWILVSDDLIKIINFQKSSFSNECYINYGYIIKSIPMENFSMHIYNRLSSAEDNTQKSIDILLDLDSNINDAVRVKELCEIIRSNIIAMMQKINSENDILSELKNRSNLNDIPLIVKKHFNL